MNFNVGNFAGKNGRVTGNKYSSTGGKGLREIRYDRKFNVSKKIVPFDKNFYAHIWQRCLFSHGCRLL